MRRWWDLQLATGNFFSKEKERVSYTIPITRSLSEAAAVQCEDVTHRWYVIFSWSAMMRVKQNGFPVHSGWAGKDFLLNTAVPSSGVASICMLKSSPLSEVPAPAVISIWAEGTESKSRSVLVCTGRQLSECQCAVLCERRRTKQIVGHVALVADAY